MGEEQAWGWGSNEGEDDNEADDASIAIENNYYEGDGMKDKNPKGALEKFKEVLKLEKDLQD